MQPQSVACANQASAQSPATLSAAAPEIQLLSGLAPVGAKSQVQGGCAKLPIPLRVRHPPLLVLPLRPVIHVRTSEFGDPACPSPPR
eukprot:7123149-Pyramimonas_sp.AAC.1